MQENNKRIFKNTFFLYGRMFIMMVLSFFTTRIVLEKLGVSDYGVNNLVAGFVSSFKVLNNILEGGTRRFLAFYLGKNDKQLVKVTFSTAFTIHLVIAFVVVLALESIGLWFLNNDLNIETDRMYAANVLFQLSVFTTFLSITQTPFSACITSHERFDVYAYMSIFDVVAKILVLYLLVYIPGDKLIIYGILLAIVATVNILIYRLYCIKKFDECGFSLKTNKVIFKEMMKFSGWSALGHISVVLNGQGISILLNLFFNTTMNAARGLADTVSFTINQFVGGFLVAATPQLTKYYSEGNKESFEKLIFNISQYTIFLLSIICVPVVMELDYVLQLWLNEVPKYASDFVKIGFLCNMIGYSNSMVDQGIVATGNVKKMNIYGIPIYFLTLPMIYIVLKLGCYPPIIYFIVSIPVLIHFIINLKILSELTGFPAKKYFINIFLKNCVITMLAMIIPFIIKSNMNSGIIRFIIVCSISVINTVLLMYLLSLDKDTKKYIYNILSNKIHIKKNSRI